MSETRPPTALLCEFCGYSLEGLEPDDACPECATPVSASLGRPPGSAWQRTGNPLYAIAEGVFRPRRMMRNLRPGSLRDWPLVVTCALIAALAPAMVFALAHQPPPPGLTQPTLVPITSAQWWLAFITLWGKYTAGAAFIVVLVPLPLWLLAVAGSPKGSRRAMVVAVHAATGLAAAAVLSWLLLALFVAWPRATGAIDHWAAAGRYLFIARGGQMLGVQWYITLFAVGAWLDDRAQRRNGMTQA